MMWVRFDLGSEGGHATINAAVIDDDLVAPDCIEDLIAREREARTPHKELQDAKFFCGQRDFIAVSENFVGGDIQCAVAKFKHPGRLTLPTAEKGSGARKQFANAKRFGHVVIRPQLKATD